MKGYSFIPFHSSDLLNFICYALLCIYLPVVLLPTIVSASVPPKLNSFVFPLENIGGLTTRTTCTANTGDQPIDFIWLKDGLNITDELTVIKKLDDYNSALTIGPLFDYHIGNYTCIARNIAGIDSVSSLLIVKISPTWIYEPKNVSVQLHESLILPCSAKGSPKPNIYWTLEGQRLVNSYKWNLLSNGSLVLLKSLKEDSASYTCHVSNGVGSSLSKTVTVSVLAKPKVDEKFKTINSEKGKEVILTCSAEGDPPLDFYWTKNGKNLSDLKYLQHRLTFEQVRNQFTISQVHISHTTGQDSGNYKCLVKNHVGEDRSINYLTVMEKPDAPNHLEASDVWSRDIRIRYRTPYSGSSSIKMYLLEYWEVFDPNGVHRNITYQGESNSIILKDLLPATSYRLQIWAINAAGASPPSQQLQFITSEEEPSGAPLDIHVEGKGSTFIKLSWKPPDDRLCNGKLLGYYVGYYAAAYEKKQTFILFTAPFINGTQTYVLRGLQRSSSYYLTISAYNNVGMGPASPEILVRTKEETPSSPVLNILSVSTTSLNFRVLPNQSSATGYVIFYKNEKDPNDWSELRISRSSNDQFVLGDLKPGTLYQIFAISQGTNGESDPSEKITIKTAFAFEDKDVPFVIEENDDSLAFARTIYVLIPVVVATFLIVVIIVSACVYISYHRPPSLPLPYSMDTVRLYDRANVNLERMPCPHPPDKCCNCEAAVPVCATLHRQMRLHNMDDSWKNYSLPNVNRNVVEEPIYETVMEEMRTVIKKPGLQVGKESGEVFI